MADNAINRARWRSVMAMHSFVTAVTDFNINGQSIQRATTAKNQFMNIERYFNENQSLGKRLLDALFGNGGFFSNHGYQDTGHVYRTHVEELLGLIQTVLTHNDICRQQLQARIDHSQGGIGISAQEFNSGPYENSKNLCFQAIETIAEKNLKFLDYIGDGVGAEAQASRSIEEVLYFNSADISPFTAILDRLLTEEDIITKANHAQTLRDTLNSWMMFFEIPISERLDLFGNILTQDINSNQVIATLQDNIIGYAMNSRTILNNPQTGLNTAQVEELTKDGINPYREAWRLMGEAAVAGTMRSDDPGIGGDNDPNQPLRPKTALYCTLISFLTSGPSIAVRLRLLEKHFAELLSSRGNGFVRVGDGDNPVQAPPAAVARYARFKKHMVRINALPQALLNDPNIPVNHFRRNLSMCFETMFPSIIEGGSANFDERKEALEQFEDPDYVQPNGANAWESSEEESDGGGSGMDVEGPDYGGGRRRRKRTRIKKKRKRKKTKRKRKKTRRKRKKTRRKSKRRRKTRKK